MKYFLLQPCMQIRAVQSVGVLHAAWGVVRPVRMRSVKLYRPATAAGGCSLCIPTLLLTRVQLKAAVTLEPQLHGVRAGVLRAL